ncbi:hypothetical protein Pfo_020584 [Paulownia fortunei]|nr:hypothetical protein Pfo_020584 [Paulownia fortunei]
MFLLPISSIFFNHFLQFFSYKGKIQNSSMKKGIFDCSSTMAKLTIDVPMNLKKIEPKANPMRRNSTGNSSIQITEPKAIPNYLRASIGTCHDFCKYGIKRDFQAKSRPRLSPKQGKNVNIMLEERSDKNHRGKKVLASTKLVSVSARQQPNELKPKPFGSNALSHQSAVKQPNRTFLKGSSNIRICRNDSGKDIRTSKTSKKSSSLPLASSSFGGSSFKVSSPKSRTRKSFPRKVSQLEIKNCVEKSETEKTSHDNVPEKIIHVIEPKDENQNDSLAPDSHKCTALSSSSNQNQKMDSAAEIRSRAKRGGRVIPEEKESSPRKLKFRRGKVLEIQNENDGSMDKSLRRLVSDGEFIHKKNDSSRGALRRQAVEQKNRNPGLLNAVIEETASKLVKMRKSKVKALVGAFESVINIQDSESSRTSTTF